MKKLDPKNDFSPFRFTLVCLGFIFLVFSYAIEDTIVDTEWFKNIGKKIIRKKEPKNKYKRIQKDIDVDAQWPIINKITFNN